MSLIYNKTNWKDDKTTPVNAKNLNNIEDGVEYIYHKWDKIIQDSTTGDHAAELIDARYGPNDTEQHPTLGHRLNHMDNKFKEVNSQLEHKANKNELKIHFIKLNNFGESILIQFRNKNLLVDFGQIDDKDTILSYLNKFNVTKLDYIILTHYHGDHIGSLEYILNSVDVSNCKAYLPCEPDFTRFNMNGEFFRSATSSVYNVLNTKNIEKIFPSENQTVDLGEIKLKFNNCNLEYFENYYNTTSEYGEEGETDYNNFSLVTTILHENVKILLPSDINVAAQETILNDVEKCDVYKTEHHSTNSKIYKEYLNKINPNISICCNVDQSSIYCSETSLHHFKNKKEYYVTHKDGDIVVCSNGNMAYIKTNNTRFEGEEKDIFYNFKSVVDDYDETTDLITVVKAMPSGSKLITTINKGYATCPDFVSDYNATIEIYKVSSNRANLLIKDSNYKMIKTFDGVWHSSNGDNIKWSENINTDVIKYYKSFTAIDDNYNENTTLISLIKKMDSNSKLEANLEKGYATCPDFVSDYNATIEIYKVTVNRATITIKDFDYYDIKVYEGIWHNSNGDNIKWGKIHFENQRELKTYNSMSSLSVLGINETDDALTILKALPVGGFYSGNVRKTFASFLSSFGGIATIEKVSVNQCRIIVSDSNSTLGKTWIGIYHSSNGNVIKWSLLNSTMI